MANEENPMWGVTYQTPALPAPSIVRPAITEDTFEIKGQFLNMLRDLLFDGRRVHDPFRHVESFIEICDLFKHKGASEDAIRLRVFPFTLTGEAKDWVKSLEPGAITSWDLLRNAFINQYFPPAKADQLKNEITGFVQRLDETLTAAWDRYKNLLRSCPTHKLSKEEQVKTFYRGISETSQAILDQSSGGIFMYKSASQAYKLLDDMAVHRRSWAVSPRETVKVVGLQTTGESSKLHTQVNDLSKQLEVLTLSIQSLTTGGEKPMMSEEEVSFMNNRNYQAGNFGYRPSYNQNRDYPPRGPSGFTNQRPFDKPEPLHLSPVEAALKQFVEESTKITTELQRGHLNLEQNLRNQQATIQNLERDVGRIAKTLTERPVGGLPSNTQTNPRNENVSAILTRSGVQVTPAHLDSPVVDSPNINKEPKEKTANQNTAEKNAEKKQEEASQQQPETYKPKAPYPQRLKSEKIKEKYAKFLEIIKQVHLNVPLVDLLKGMPNYGRFIKELVSNKEKLEELSSIRVGEDCSAAFTKTPPKLGDTGSFTIPCFVGDIFLCNSLADLGASINLMPLSLYQGLGLEELKPTKMTVQLADRSIKYPVGIAENVPVRVDKFTFPVDFVIMEMPEDLKVPIILGRPFLNTADAIIHVTKRTLSLGVGNERVSFSIDKALLQPNAFDDTCNFLDIVDECVHDSLRLAFS